MTRTLLCFLSVLCSSWSFTQDTIPFTIGENNKIYIKVRVNNSDTLNFMFDTGADVCAIKKAVSVTHAHVTIDGKEENAGIGGISVVETSSQNALTIHTLTQKDQKLVVLDYEDEQEDGIIGWTFFQDKIIHINYGIRKIIVYDKLPAIPEEYTKIKCKRINNLYFIRLTLVVNGKKMSDWYELDTGSDGSLRISNLLGTKRRLFGKMIKIGESAASGTDGNVIQSDLVLLNEVRIKNYRFYRIPIDLETTPNTVEYNDIIGNNFLKRFHLYLDFRNNMLYLKVNNLVHSPYIESLIE